MPENEDGPDVTGSEQTESTDRDLRRLQIGFKALSGLMMAVGGSAELASRQLRKFHEMLADPGFDIPHGSTSEYVLYRRSCPCVKCKLYPVPRMEYYPVRAHIFDARMLVSASCKYLLDLKMLSQLGVR